MTDIAALAQSILTRDRRAMARAITLVESVRADHRVQALELIETLRQSGREALRIGLSGTPGVGKSTFIERFGLRLTGQGLSVAVLAVDPSSTRSGGSILGDKTRMEQLSRDPNAYIRPSPAQSFLGGVARRSREAVAICEAAGFDVVLIETVGVGQSETLVAELSDVFVLLMSPAGGDELQGVKRGIMEIADLILVNKADGDLKAAASRTEADYAGALRLLRKRSSDPDGFPKAASVSALEDHGLESAWMDMQNLAAWRKSQGIWTARRSDQAVHWFRDAVDAGLRAKLVDQPKTKALYNSLSQAVALGESSPDLAAETLLSQVLGPQLKGLDGQSS
ncbi:MAG: methylmalonyl Co-A mutase-associated GTPase MeaB [Pseudomonadota bacterium]